MISESAADATTSSDLDFLVNNDIRIWYLSLLRDAEIKEEGQHKKKNIIKEEKFQHKINDV